MDNAIVLHQLLHQDTSENRVAIPFNKPFIVGNELQYISRAVQLGNVSGDGEFTLRSAQLLQDQFAIQRVLLTPSCTAALEMAAMLCDLGPGDEVVLPSFTFVSTANAIVRCGATPVFAEIRPDTLNLDERLVEAAISPRCKAIMVIHYAGVACEMDRFREISQKHGLMLIEDAAQGVNAAYRGKPLGALGDLATYSFHETKNYICGEGGALCINQPELIERAEILRDKGTNRQRFFRGEVDKYTWVDVGSSYVPSEIACAFLYGQLENIEAITEQRKKIFVTYRQHLQPLADAGQLRLPHVPDHCQTNYHTFYLLLDDRATRDALLQHLRGLGIHAVFHYVPLHDSPMGKQVGRTPSELSVTNQVSDCLLRLPLFHELTSRDQQHVIDGVKSFFA